MKKIFLCAIILALLMPLFFTEETMATIISPKEELERSTTILNITTMATDNEYDSIKPTKEETEVSQIETTVATTTTTKPTFDKPLYKDLETAVKDFNNKTFKNANATEKDANIEIDIQKKTITILDKITINNTIDIEKNCTIFANGNMITMNKNGGINVHTGVEVIIEGEKAEFKKICKETDVPYIFNVSGTLKANNATFLMDSPEWSSNIMHIEQGSVEIIGCKMDVIAYDNVAQIISAKNANAITMKENTMSIQSVNGRIMGLSATYEGKEFKQITNITSENNNIKVTSTTGTVKGFYISSADQCVVTNNTVYAQVEKCNDMIDLNAVALEIKGCKSLTINDGSYVAVQTSPEAFYESYGIDELCNDKLIINGGTFCGYTSYINSNTEINNATFSGIHSGVQLNGKENTVYINGGKYESPWHGGMYVCCKEAYINGATLGSPLFEQGEYYKRTKLVPIDDNGSVWSGTLYSCMYLGSPFHDVNAQVENVKFEFAENLKTDYVIAITTNHGHKNTLLHIKNLKTDFKIRIDGENEKGYSGHLWTENVEHSGIVGKGKIHTEKENESAETEVKVEDTIKEEEKDEQPQEEIEKKDEEAEKENKEEDNKETEKEEEEVH